MSDQTEDELVRRLTRRPKGALIGTMAVIVVVAAIVLMVGPIAMQPSVSETLPKALDVPKPPTGEERRQRTADGGTMRVDPAIPEGLPFGVRATASQTVIVAFVPFDGSEASIGNGILIRDGVVLAPAHLYTSPQCDAHIQVYCGGKVVAGAVRKQAELRDLAIIGAKGCDAEPVRVSRKRLTPSDKLYVSGFVFLPALGGSEAERRSETTSFIPDAVPDPEELEPEAAALIRAMRKQRMPPLVAVHGTIIRGQSGSPVTLASGELVGMMILNYPRKSQSFMVPASSIVRILRDAGLDP